ncbi:hypothetical protein L209DRAFT_291956 [Thermothelomyces heterothallicus CBS 203.75]
MLNHLFRTTTRVHPSLRSLIFVLVLEQRRSHSNHCSPPTNPTGLAGATKFCLLSAEDQALSCELNTPSSDKPSECMACSRTSRSSAVSPIPRNEATSLVGHKRLPLEYKFSRNLAPVAAVLLPGNHH